MRRLVSAESAIMSNCIRPAPARTWFQTTTPANVNAIIIGLPNNAPLLPSTPTIRLAHAIAMKMSLIASLLSKLTPMHVNAFVISNTFSSIVFGRSTPTTNTVPAFACKLSPAILGQCGTITHAAACISNDHSQPSHL